MKRIEQLKKGVFLLWLGLYGLTILGLIFPISPLLDYQYFYASGSIFLILFIIIEIYQFNRKLKPKNGQETIDNFYQDKD